MKNSTASARKITETLKSKLSEESESKVDLSNLAATLAERREQVKAKE